MAEAAARTKAKIDLKDQRILLWLIILVLCVVVTAINPRFLSVDNIMVVLQQVSVVGILTMGMALLLISGGIDLSMGSIMVFSAVVMAKVIMGGGDPALAIVAGLSVSTLFGFINGVIIAKSRCLPLIITLGMANVYFGISLVVSNGKFLNFQQKFEWIRRTKLWDVVPVYMLAFFALVVAFTAILLNLTKTGRRIVAVGGNEENAYLSGLRVNRFKILAYTVSGFFCGVASIVFAARLDSVTSSATSANYELSALTASIVGGVTFEGGRGTILGAFTGVLLIGLLSNAMTVLSINSYIQKIVQGAIIVLAVVFSNMDKIKRN
jgi:ribose/xylose/arabinose/galactoside ABC-type transport system permease subunit